MTNIVHWRPVWTFFGSIEFICESVCVCGMFQRVFECVFKGRFKSVLWVFHECFKVVSRMFPGCFTCVLSVLQG